jgi:hypothetical protein
LVSNRRSASVSSSHTQGVSPEGEGLGCSAQEVGLVSDGIWADGLVFAIIKDLEHEVGKLCLNDNAIYVKLELKSHSARSSSVVYRVGSSCTSYILSRSLEKLEILYTTVSCGSLALIYNLIESSANLRISMVAIDVVYSVLKFLAFNF